jgi:hypothetical protein
LGRIAKFAFLVYFAWTVGIVPALGLIVTPFLAVLVLWGASPDGAEFVLSAVGLIALPALAIAAVVAI